MIVDAAFVPQLGVGAERAVQQPGDTQLVVPGMALPTVPLMLISRVSSNNAQINSQSFFCEQQNTATNQAAVGTTICTLGKGLWRIQCTLSARFNYLGVSPNIDVEFNLVWNAIWSIRLAHLYAVVGSQSITIDRTFLFDVNTQLVLSQGLTGAVEINESSVGVNAIRML